ncbi:MAG: hypothetical protein DRP29_01320 [Thermodesulfobacteriota bacterium]|nr:MAG: hypothetical protein DRP29_01320 [Thermodesulfobacteriota bacterium]
MLKEYQCTYVEPSGIEKKIIISARDTKEAIKRLKEQGFVVTEVKEKTKKEVSFTLRKGITQQDLYNIANQLSILIRSGMKIDEALNLLANTSKKQKLKEVLTAINQEIKSGQSVTKAIEKNKLFPSVCVSMIYVGESIGNLSTAFDNVAQYLKFQIELKREIINSLTYPFFLILASIVTLIFMFNFIIPRFFAIFETTGKLPLPAKFIFTVATVFNIKVIFLLFVVLLVFFILKQYKIVNLNTKKITGITNKIPLIKSLFFYLELSRFCYSMHSMLRSGVEFIKAVKLSAEIIQDGALKDAFLASINEIKKGKRIAEVYSQIALLPDIFINLVVIGDESGNLSEIFFELYQIFNDRFKTAIRRFLVLLEPTIIVFMGIIVGFVVISLILTVMNVGTIKF